MAACDVEESWVRPPPSPLRASSDTRLSDSDFVLKGFDYKKEQFNRCAHLHQHNLSDAPLLTSDLLLECHDHLHGHVQDAQFSLRLVRLQVRHAHPAELLKRLIYVPDSYPDEKRVEWQLMQRLTVMYTRNRQCFDIFFVFFF